MLRPDLLCCPNVPKPLHGINPRTILGVKWWDYKRREAYHKANYCCCACGVSKQEADYKQWLEGHEYYDLDYVNGTAVLKEIVALCYSCHSFIHSGRLYVMYRQGKISLQTITNILVSRLDIIKENGLIPFYGTVQIASDLNVYNNQQLKEWYKIGEENGPKSVAEWSKWKLVIEGKEYKGKFNSLTEWEEFYG